MADTAAEKQVLLSIKRPSFPDISGTNTPTQPNTNTCCSSRTAIEPLQLCYFIANIASQPLIQQYLYYRFAEEYDYADPNSNATSCQNIMSNQNPAYQRVQKSTSEFNTITILCTSIPIIFSVAITGPLSDKKGRKPFLILALFGSLIRAAVTSVVMYNGLSLYWLVGLALFEGCLGGPGTVLAMLYAYAADRTTKGERLSHYKVLDFLHNIAYASALLLIGYFITIIGFAWSMFFISCLLLVCLIYAITLEETVSVQTITSEEVKHIPTKVIMLYSSNDNAEKRTKLILVICSFLIFMMIDIGSYDILTYFLLNPPICMSSDEIGLYACLAFIARGGGSFVAINLVQGILPELGLASAGCLCAVAYYLALASVNSSATSFFVPLFGFISLAQVPIMRSFASRLGSHKEQGALMASFSMMQMLAFATGGSVYNSIYSEVLVKPVGFTYRISAILIFIPTAMIMYLWFIVEREAKRRALLPDYSNDYSQDCSLTSSTELSLSYNEQLSHTSSQSGSGTVAL